MSELTAEDRIIADAAMTLTAEAGWAALTLHSVAIRSGLKLVDVLQRCPSKYTVLCRISEIATHDVLAQISPEAFAAETPKAKLHELLLMRFEALTPYKAGLKSVAEAALCDPGIGVAACLTAPQAMALLLEAANIRPLPWKVLGLTALAAHAGRTWFDDATPDLGPTTAALDSLLTRAERFI